MLCSQLAIHICYYYYYGKKSSNGMNFSFGQQPLRSYMPRSIRILNILNYIKFVNPIQRIKSTHLLMVWKSSIKTSPILSL